MEKLKQKKMKVSVPSDILIDIFSRVPAKSIFRFRCLSKFWRSIFGLPYFTEMFLTKSLARPRLLFAIHVDKYLLFYSAPQPQNPVDNSTLVATPYNKCFPKDFAVSPPLRGLVFLRESRRERQMIFNPVTGESITLPEVNAMFFGRNYLGYDQINKQFKVLYMAWQPYNTHWVLTLETGNNLIWRKTMECEPHGAGDGEICINGVLYYRAYFEGPCMIGCFDFSSEKFSFINYHEEMRGGTLVNYKGNLGVLVKSEYEVVLVKREYEVVLWVLEEEDAGKHKWCKSSISVPLSLHEIWNDFYIVGMTGAGEIVFSTYREPDPFNIIYYNIERKTFTRVNIHIHGLEEFYIEGPFFVRTFLDYVENLKLL